jgi:uncharacterized membrane protein (DUF4010 family)
LLVLIAGSFVVAGVTADWEQTIAMELDSPFSVRYALGFGAMFLVVLLAGAIAQAQFGTAGFLVTAVISGLVSSAGATTSAVLLFRGGTLSPETTVLAVLLATASSVVVKAGLTFASPNRPFARRVAFYSGILVAVGGLATVAVVLT